jgi:uncharacterized membrane protein SirB2
MTSIMQYIQQAMFAIPYILMGASVFQAVRAKAKQNEIIYMLWTIIFLMIIIADAVVK